jgi:membrane associated rhomboid family serine protease
MPLPGDPSDPAPGAEIIHPPSERKAHDWMAALGADGIPYALHQHGSAWELVVPEARRDQAWRCIRAFEDANRGWPPRPGTAHGEPARAHPVASGLWGCGLLLLVFLTFGPYDDKVSWLRAAASDGGAPWPQQWWRPITALTLHADFPHLGGNLLFLAVLGAVVCARHGLGLGWTLILAAGALGNLLTATLMDPGYVAVGASTGCFGALGIIAMDQAIRNYRRFGHWRSIWSRVWIPLCAGLAMLGFLGTHPGSDLAGHACGFLVGLVLVLPWTGSDRLRPGVTVDAFLKVGSVLTVMAAWQAAITFARYPPP